MRSEISALVVSITASVVLITGTARAASYVVTTKNRFFCCTNPALFIVGGPQLKGGVQETVVATASVTGTGTPPIKIGMGHVARSYSMASQSMLGGLKYVLSTFSVSNGSGTLEKSGGNLGAFSFCPKAKGPGPGACTNPGKATPAYFNGRIAVTPGPNKFGGTLQILAGARGIGGSKLKWYRTTFLTIVNRELALSPIGAMTPVKVNKASATVMYGPFGTFGSYPSAMLWQNGAGPFTTGMVTVQASRNSRFRPARTVMLTGYDNRTPMGLGNIQIVSGILANGYNGYEVTAFLNGSFGGSSIPLGWRMQINTVPEPSASVGLAAGSLGFLLVGLLHGRRRARRAE